MEPKRLRTTSLERGSKRGGGWEKKNREKGKGARKRKGERGRDK